MILRLVNRVLYFGGDLRFAFLGMKKREGGGRRRRRRERRRKIKLLTSPLQGSFKTVPTLVIYKSREIIEKTLVLTVYINKTSKVLNKCILFQCFINPLS